MKKLISIRNKEKKYYVKYRETKRNENEQEYLQHNAEIQKTWRHNNEQHVASWKTKNVNYRLCAIKQQAKKKNIQWDDDTMTSEHCTKLMTSPCYYCAFISDDTVNGIDRMDATGYYTTSNCVSCCKNCNFIKKCLDPITFINRCKHISHNFNGIGGEIYKDIWNNSKSVNYNSYKKRALQKDLIFQLSDEEFINIKSRSCYYCNRENTNIHNNGIDRKDNKIGYTLNNCVTCCSECNQMKSDMSDVEFINHCKIISEYSSNNNLEFPKIKTCLKTICKRINKNN